MIELKNGKFQFTPLREGRQERLITAEAERNISIHAPPRGATQHHPEWRSRHFDFNSRPSARGDNRPVCFLVVVDISIHAPPRGATFARRKRRSTSISIHAPPRGATRCLPDGCESAYFNSRPSARGDVPNAEARSAIWDFNSRPSARGDFNFYREAFDNLIISIHAPPRGATCNISCRDIKSKISIHAPPRGATASGSTRRLRKLISIHAPPRGATCSSRR